MQGLWVIIYPWVFGPLIASVALLLGHNRGWAERAFATFSLVLALGNYVVQTIWWNEGCWDAGIPCEGRAIEELSTYIVIASIATGLVCIAWVLRLWLGSRGERVT